MYIDDPTRLRHMLDAAREALDYTVGRTRQDLERERTMQHSLTRCLEILGEAARTVTPARRAIEVDIPWQDVIGIRNRIIHEYFRVDLDIVWNTVVGDLPPLIRALESSLSNSDKP